MSQKKEKLPKAFRERSKVLFNNDILSDVKFVVQSSQDGDCSDSKRSKMAIPAHKFLLSIRSPVFFAMFCGKMAETQEYIDLPDCEYVGMFELLRFLYTDKVCLTENNVMQVGYLAAKYMIPRLAKECATFLGKNLDSSNVLGVLKHAQKFSNEDLLYYCWDLIDKLTRDVLKSSEFLAIERSLLQEIVGRDTMNIREVELFRGVDRWAEQECKRLKQDASGPVKRQILGEQIIRELRFPVMEQSEFMDVVVHTAILTQEEMSDIIMKFLNPTVTPLHGFLETEREGPPLRCCRYHDFVQIVSCSNDPDTFHPVEITVDKDILLHGISIFADETDLYATFSVTVNVHLGSDPSYDSLILSQTGTFDVERQKNIDSTYHGFDVLFDDVVALKRNVQYCIAVSVELPWYSFYYDFDNCNLVHYNGVTFTFNKTDTVVAEFLYKEEL